MSTQSPSFSSDANIADDNYRPLSVAAVLTLVAGLISVLALFHPTLVILPITTVVIAVFTLFRFRQAAQPLSGQWLATVGVTLALFFGCWSLTYQAIRGKTIFTQAEVFAQEWFQLVQEGDIYRAYELTLYYSDRHLPNTDLSKIYGDGTTESPFPAGMGMAMGGSPDPSTMEGVPSESMQMYSGYISAEPVKTIIENAKNGKLTLIRNSSVASDGFLDNVIQVYRFSYTDASGIDREIEVKFTFERWWPLANPDYQWNLKYVENYEEKRQTPRNRPDQMRI